MLEEPGFAGIGPRIPLREMVPVPRLAGAVWLRNARVFSKLWRGALLPTFLDPVPVPARDGLRARHLRRPHQRHSLQGVHRPGPDRLGGDVVLGLRDDLQRLLPDERAPALRQRPVDAGRGPGRRRRRPGLERQQGHRLRLRGARGHLGLRAGLLLVGPRDPALRLPRRALLLGDRLHVHHADPEDRPLLLLLHPRDHADVPVLGALLPVQQAARLGPAWWPGSCRSTTWSRSPAAWRPGPELWSIVGNAAWLAILSALLFTIPVRALRKKLVA